MDETPEQAAVTQSSPPLITARSIPHYPYARALATLSYPNLRMKRSTAAIDLIIIAGVIFFSQIAVGALVYWLQDHVPSLSILWINILFGIVSLISIAVILSFRGQRPATIGLKQSPWKRSILGTMAAVPVCYIGVISSVTIYVILSGIDTNALIQERSKLFDILPDLSLGTILTFTFFVGLHEEILFRGFVLTRLNAVFHSPTLAIIFSSVIFGMMHVYQGPIGVVQTTAVGLVLAILVTWTRSIWPAIAAHMFFDAISLSVIPYLRDYMQTFAHQLTTTTSAPF